MHANENLVDVKYHVFVRDKSDGRVEELSETHTMRYLFAPEVQLLLSAAGLRTKQLHEFMSERDPGFHTWSAVFVAAREE